MALLLFLFPHCCYSSTLHDVYVHPFSLVWTSRSHYFSSCFYSSFLPSSNLSQLLLFNMLLFHPLLVSNLSHILFFLTFCSSSIVVATILPSCSTLNVFHNYSTPIAATTPHCSTLVATTPPNFLFILSYSSFSYSTLVIVFYTMALRLSGQIPIPLNFDMIYFSCKC